MIKSLLLQNFKSHKKTKLNFHKGLNAIIGVGMSGKTNIIRSIKMLQSFRPSNKRYKSNFASKSSTTLIQLNTYDKKTITLERKNKVAKYILETPTDKQEFRKFGKQVPVEIQKALGIEEINTQYQLDSPYIVLNTSGQITKIINSITEIDKVDNWSKKINGEIRDLNVILKERKKEKKEIFSELSSLKTLHKIEPIINKIEKIQKKEKQLEQEYLKIESIIYDIEKLYEEKQKLSKGMKVVAWAKKLERVEKETIKLEEQKEDLEDLIEMMNSLEQHKRNLITTIALFIKQIKKKKKCHFCLSPITDKTVKRIQNEIYNHI